MFIYTYHYLSKGLYLCVKKDKEDNVVARYNVDIRDGKTFCSCKRMYFSKNKKICKHARFILEQLKDKDNGIIRLDHNTWRQK